MQTDAEESETEPMTTYRIRLMKQDVEGLRRLARTESQRLQRDVGWCVLLRDAVRKMAADQRAIG